MAKTEPIRNRGDTSDRSGMAGTSMFGAKKPIFIFVGGFVLLLGVFYAVTFIPFMSHSVLPGMQEWNARMSARILNVFREGASAYETQITSSRYSVNIAHGCDAIEPIGLFLAAVLAFPSSLRSKLPGLIIGVGLLVLMNFVRIISLFYTGIYWPTAFDTMHIDVWQPAFVVLSLFFWVSWALWATKPRPISASPA
ncbi:MAG: archaeosortase/exosortase family protein [Planctomycetes bacterium]|nr:archaeosortase/exosortase family protein [Planctomycetota bacterium]MBI3835874.1 archaeosortase/exosortase family protein [Planctomycetota bacterium]